MKYFLSVKRRSRLVADLVTLTMPALMAQEWAYLPDDTDAVDHALQRVIIEFVEHCRDRSQSQDEHEQRTLHAFIEAELLVLRSYLGEIHERDIPGTRFPNFNSVVGIASETSGLWKRLILAEMPCGTLH
jgi:hypothetical protein